MKTTSNIQQTTPSRWVRKLFAFDQLGLSKPTGERLLRMKTPDGLPLIPCTSFSDEEGALGSKTVMVDLNAFHLVLDEQYERKIADQQDGKGTDYVETS